MFHFLPKYLVEWVCWRRTRDWQTRHNSKYDTAITVVTKEVQITSTGILKAMQETLDVPFGCSATTNDDNAWQDQIHSHFAMDWQYYIFPTWVSNLSEILGSEIDNQPLILKIWGKTVRWQLLHAQQVKVCHFPLWFPLDVVDFPRGH
jgi:hypothetical protein